MRSREMSGKLYPQPGAKRRLVRRISYMGGLFSEVMGRQLSSKRLPIMPIPTKKVPHVQALSVEFVGD